MASWFRLLKTTRALCSRTGAAIRRVDIWENLVPAVRHLANNQLANNDGHTSSLQL